MLIQILALIVLALISGEGFAHESPGPKADVCRSSLTTIGPEEREALAQHLSRMPIIGPSVMQMMSDPQVPSSFKRIVKIALIDEKTTIVKMTEALRSDLTKMNRSALALMVPYEYRLVAASGSSPPDPEGRVSVEDATMAFDHIAHGIAEPSVIVEDRAISSSTNDFIVVMHELSHIRFNAFFERNIGKLLDRLPENFIRRGADGVIEVNIQFYHFMTERYAHQLEYALLKTTLGRYFDHSYGVHAFLLGEQVEESFAKAMLAAIVSHNYVITDPAVTALEGHTFADVLLGIPFRGKTDVRPKN